jgi:hypothetical protein
MSASFKIAFNLTMKNEGGYSNLSTDKGGETYRGISRVSNPGWKGWMIIDGIKAKRNIKHGEIINDKHLNELTESYYYINYWMPNKLNLMKNQDFANFAFDTIVLHGQGAKIINRAVNTTPGTKKQPEINRITSDTLHEINNSPAKIYPYMVQERKQYIKSLPDYNTNGGGWMERLKIYPEKIKDNIMKGLFPFLFFFVALFLLSKILSKSKSN